MTPDRQELLATFLDEAEGYLRRIAQILSQHTDEPLGVRASLHDVLHNFKGAASTVQLDPIAQAAAAFSKKLGEMEARGGATVSDLEEESRTIRLALVDMLEAVREGRSDDCVGIWKNVAHVSESGLQTGGLPDSVSDELRELFVEEAGEILKGMRRSVAELSREPESAIERNRLFRYLMNIKGSAAMVEQEELFDVLSVMVAVFEDIEVGRLTIDNAVSGFFESALAALEGILRNLTRGERRHVEIMEAFRHDIELILPRLIPQDTEDESLDYDAPPILDDMAMRRHLEEAFMQESQEHLAALGQHILEAENGDRSSERVQQVYRVVHTLKGAAATVGNERVARAAHRLEDLFDLWREKEQPLDEVLLDVLYRSESILRRLIEIGTEKSEEGDRLVGDLYRLVAQILPAGQTGGDPAAESMFDEAANSQTVPASSERPVESVLDPRTFRVSMARMDQMINLVSELSSYRTRLDDLTGLFSGLSKKLKWERKNLSKLVGDFQRKHQWSMPLPGMMEPNSSGFSDLEFDHYSDLAVFARNLEDLDHRISSVFKILESLLVNFTEQGYEFNTLVSKIQDEMIQIRMVPMDTFFRTLTYQSMNIARSLGKKLRVFTYGGQTEIDKSVIDTIADSLLHVIRNCLDHGIELPEERERLGKSATGVLRLSASTEERSVVLRIDDDGAGIDVNAIAEVALQAGLMNEEDLKNKSREELLNLVFHPQISTRPKAGTVSGRGVGMDAVRHAIAELYGSISLESEPEAGTRVTIKLPMTIAVQPILFVTAERFHFSLPMNYVETIVEPGMVDLDAADEESLSVNGEILPVNWLAGFFRLDHERNFQRLPVIILKAGDRRMALVVNAVTGRDDVIVRQLPNLLDASSHFLGTAVTVQGDVRPVLNVPFLFELDDDLPAMVVSDPGPPRKVEVLVADDSLSVRKTLAYMLAKHGMRVTTAKDGLVALQKVQTLKPDLVIVDLEMPNLNGYELMERVRENPETAHLPLLVLTSRGGAKHHQRALTAGADGFLSKPVLERKLVQNIMALLPAVLRDLVDTERSYNV